MANTRKRKAESEIVRDKRSRLMIGTMRLPTFAEHEHDYAHFLQRLADQASEAEMFLLKSNAA
jgi:hypothetical protein